MEKNCRQTGNLCLPSQSQSRTLLQRRESLVWARGRQVPADGNAEDLAVPNHQAATFFSVIFDSSTTEADLSAAAQEQAPSHLNHSRKAFHHFCQKLGALCTLALVVFIASQVFGCFGCFVRIGRRTFEPSAPVA